MTTNACLWSLQGPKGGIGGSANSTDDQFTEMMDNVSSLSLYKVAKGLIINSFIFSYTAGSGQLRVRNTRTNVVKMLEAGTMPKGMHVVYLAHPFVVEDNDIVEIYTTAAGS